MHPPKSSAAIAPHWVAGASGTASLLIGGVAFVGARSDVSALPPVVRESMHLPEIAALCFVLSGAALWLLQLPGRRSLQVGRLCTLLLLGIALVSLMEHVTGWDSGIGRMLSGATPPATGQMEPDSAVSFSLTAAALWWMSQSTAGSRRPLILGWLGTLVMVTGLFAGLSQISGFTSGAADWSLTRTAAYTAPLFFLAGAALLAVAWRESKEQWLIERWITAGIAAGLALLVALAVYLHWSTRSLVETADDVRHSHQVLTQISSLRITLEDLQSEMRGFLLAGTNALSPLSLNLVPRTLQKTRDLRQLVNDNPSQRERGESLQSKANEGLEILQQLVEGQRAANPDTAATQGVVERGRTILQAIGEDLDAMEAVESELLEAREETSAAITRRTFALLPVGTVLSFALLATGLVRLNAAMGARQRGDEALRRSGRRLRLAMDAAEMGEWEVDFTTQEIHRTMRHDQIFGYDRMRPDWTYEVFLEHVHPEHRTRVDQVCRETLAAGRDGAFECRIIRHDGSFGWIWVRGAPVKDESGRLVKMLGMVRDITARKLIETELQQATDRFERALKDSPIVVFNQDLELRYTWIYNPAPGYQPEDLIGKRDSDVLERAEDAAVTESIKQDVIHTGRSRRQEVVLQQQGEERCYDLWVDPLRDEAGEISGVICVAVDLTARKQSERALRASEAEERARREELEALMDAMPVAIVISRDANCLKMTANRAAEKLLRLPPGGDSSPHASELDWANFEVRSRGRLLATNELPMQMAASTGQPVSDAEIEMGFPGGDKRDLLVSAFPLFDEAGVVRGCIGAFVDITIRKQREMNVSFLEEMQSTLASISSPEEIMRLTGERISSHLGLDHCLFCEINESGEEATVLHDHPAGELAHPAGPYNLRDFHGAGQLQQMAAGKILMINDVQQAPAAALNAGKFVALGIGSLMNASHLVDGRWKFVLSAQRRKPGEWSSEDARLLDELVERIYPRLERARAEQRLAESEARFRSIFHDAAVPMEVALPDGRFIQVNRAFCELLGYSEAELLATTFDAITHPEDRTRLALEPLRNLMDGAITSYRAEKRYHHKDGSVVWVDLSVSVVRGADGEPDYFIGQIQNITGRKRAEESLRKSENMLSLAIEAGHLGIWNWDSITRTLSWSERCNAMTGLSAGSEISQISAMGTVHPDDRRRVHGEASLALEQKLDMNLEYRTLRPDGSVRWLQTRGRAFFDAHGEVVRVTGIMQDVTERRDAEEALKRFNNELESLVEERTEVIKIAMTELQHEISERRRLEEEILEIGERAQARIGQDLHDDLGQQLVGMTILMQLLSNQLTAESHPRAADAARLESFLAETIHTTRNLAKSLYPVELERGGLMLSLHDLANRTEQLAGITCRVHEDGNFHFEKPAEIHLYRIVQESISNAVKHGKARNITIDCTARNGISTLTVTDDGSGFIPPEDGKWQGIGLHLFQYRARLIQAHLTVSQGKSGGCVVKCTWGGPAPDGPGTLES